MSYHVKSSRLKVSNTASNMLYTLLSVALLLLLLVYIPHGIYEDIERLSIHSKNLKVGPELHWHVDHLRQLSVTDIPNRIPDFTQKFDGHTWLDKSLSDVPIWLSFHVSWLSESDPVQLYID